MLVIVDEPDSAVQYGSYIAAPLGRDIMVDCLKYLNVQPDYGDSVRGASVPQVSGLTVSDAKKQLSDLGLNVKIIGDNSADTLVTYQIPSKGTRLPEGSVVLIYTNDDETQRETETVVPDLLGKTAAECNQLLAQADLNIRIVGENIGFSSTVAVSQSIAKGTLVEKGTVITVEFES